MPTTAILPASHAPRDTGPPWTPGKRAAWWLKQAALNAGVIAGLIIGIAGAAKLLGLRLDVQSQTTASEQHEAIRKDMNSADEKIVVRIEKKIDDLGKRIDDALLAAIPGARLPGKERKP